MIDLAFLKRVRIEPLDHRHDRAAFTCGDDPLDNFLKNSATKQQKADIAKVYVACLDSVTITPAMVQDWEDQARDCERQAEKKVAEAKTLRARAEAAKLLLGLNDTDTGDAAANESSTMMEAMATIANASDKPMSRSTIKTRLLTLGYPEASLGNYFYTCVARLKAKKRITVTPEGLIGKAPVS